MVPSVLLGIAVILPLLIVSTTNVVTGPVPKHISQFVKLHSQFPFKSIKGAAHLYRCDLQNGMKVDYPTIEDCQVYASISSYPKTGDSEHVVISYHPPEKSIALHRCVGERIHYSITWVFFGDNPQSIRSTEYYSVSPEDCKAAPINANLVLPQKTAGFFTSDEHTHDRIRKTTVISNYKAYSKKVFIPSDGSEADYRLGQATVGKEVYVWDTSSILSKEISKKYSCSYINTSNPGKSVFCPEANALFTVLDKAPTMLKEGVTFKQSVTGEFLSGVGSPSRGDEFAYDPHSEVASRIEGAGVIINSDHEQLVKTDMFNKCWHRNTILTRAADGEMLKAFETNIIFNRPDSVATMYYSEGYAILNSCMISSVTDYSITSDFVIMKTEEGSIMYYDPQYLMLRSEELNRPYRTGRVISFLEGVRLDVISGKLETRNYHSTDVYHYGSFSPFLDNGVPMWHPDQLAPELETPKSHLHAALDFLHGHFGIFWFYILLALIALFIFWLLSYARMYKLNYSKVVHSPLIRLEK